MPPRTPGRPPVQRRILPPTRKAPMKRPVKKPGELDDVLKRLKELGQ